jgi:hypothetical protein
MSATTILLIVGGVAIMLLMHGVGRGVAHGHSAHAGGHAAGGSDAVGAPEASGSGVTNPGGPGSAGATEDEQQAHGDHAQDQPSAEQPKRRHGCC